jgi:hypothetical protein
MAGSLPPKADYPKRRVGSSIELRKENLVKMEGHDMQPNASDQNRHDGCEIAGEAQGRAAVGGSCPELAVVDGSRYFDGLYPLVLWGHGQ